MISSAVDTSTLTGGQRLGPCCWGAREKVVEAGKESARLKAPEEARRGLEGGRDMVLCNPAV